MTEVQEAAVSLIIARNDLEAVWLAALARRAGMHIVAFDQLKWGDVMPLADPRFSDLNNTVLISELPDPAFEQQLRDRGHRVHILDHHVWTMPDNKLLDRGSPVSALEQAFRLAPNLNVTSTSAAGKLGQSGVSKLIAANDRGFISGLAKTSREIAQNTSVALGWTRAVRLMDLAMRLGANPDRVEDALDTLTALDVTEGQDALDAVKPHLGEFIKGAESALDKASKFLKNGQLVHHQPTSACKKDGIWVTFAADDLVPVLMDALYLYIADGQFEPLENVHEAVFIFYSPNETQRGYRINFSGHSKRRPLIDELWATQSQCLPAGAIQYCGGGSETCFYGAILPKHQSIDGLADCLLRNLLIEQRPVAGWRTHFMQAFSLPSTWNRKQSLRTLRREWEPEPLSPSYIHYLAPHLREILAPEKDDLHKNNVMASFQLNNPNLSLAVERKGAIQEAEISALHVHLFHENTILVEWTLEGELDDELIDEKKPLWRRLLGFETGSRWTFGDLLDFNAYARFTASTYPGPAIVLKQSGEEVARLNRSDEPCSHSLSGWFKFLMDIVLKDFGINDGEGLQPFYDERARMITSVILTGAVPDLKFGRSALDPCLGRLMTVEPWAVGWHADPEFAAQELAKGRYSRFDRYFSGTLYATTNHSFTVLAGGEGSLVKRLHDKHVLPIYRRLFILILFYGINLSHYARLLTITDIGDSQKSYLDLRERYSRFSNNLWFETVSTHIQGMELFQMMRKQSGVAAEFQQIEHEIETSSHISMQRSGEVTEQFYNRIAWFGLLLAGLTIVIDGPNLVLELLGPLLGGLPGILKPWSALAICVVFGMILAWGLRRRLFDSKEKDKGGII